MTDQNNSSAPSGDVRTAFEAVAGKHGITLERFKHQPDTYKFQHTHAMFALWQDAWSAALAALPSAERAPTDAERLNALRQESDRREAEKRHTLAEAVERAQGGLTPEQIALIARNHVIHASEGKGFNCIGFAREIERVTIARQSTLDCAPQAALMCSTCGEDRLKKPCSNPQECGFIGTALISAPIAAERADCTYPNCTCIGGGVFKPCVKQTSAQVDAEGGTK